MMTDNGMIHGGFFRMSKNFSIAYKKETNK